MPCRKRFSNTLVFDYVKYLFLTSETPTTTSACCTLTALQIHWWNKNCLKYDVFGWILVLLTWIKFLNTKIMEIETDFSTIYKEFLS